MDAAPALLVAIIVVIILIIIISYVWYHGTGWKTFTAANGDTPTWAAATGDTTHLRFKNVIFTVTVGGTTTSHDVTAIMNNMATAYNGIPVSPLNTGALVLDNPLNPFSFTIVGLNDMATVASPRNISQIPVAQTYDTADPSCQKDGAGNIITNTCPLVPWTNPVTGQPVLQIDASHPLPAVDANPHDPNINNWASATATLTGSYRTL